MFFARVNTRIVQLATMLVLLFVSTMACYPEHNQSTFDPHGPVASRQLDIFIWILIGGTIVTVLVLGALLYATFKYRRKDENEIPKQVHGNLKLEILWTVIPALVVLGFSVASINTLFYAADTPDSTENPLTLEAIGHQWWFEFSYPNPNDASNEIVTVTYM